MDNKNVGEITKRLDAIIALLSTTLQRPENPRSTREQIQLLDSAGLGPTDIAGIVGKRPKDVTSELAKLRKKNKTTKK